jgi:glucose dehydrogenase
VKATVHVVAVAFTTNNTLVIAPDTNSATLVAQVAQGTVSNLTSNATFQKMLKAAPSGAAITGYVSAAALQSLMHASDSATSGVFAHLDAMTVTLVWNNSILQGTLDTGLHS